MALAMMDSQVVLALLAATSNLDATVGSRPTGGKPRMVSLGVLTNWLSKEAERLWYCCYSGGADPIILSPCTHQSSA